MLFPGSGGPWAVTRLKREIPIKERSSTVDHKRRHAPAVAISEEASSSRKSSKNRIVHRSLALHPHLNVTSAD